MPSKTVTFGTFVLDTVNGVHIQETSEMQGAQRLVTIAELAGARGVKVLRTLLKGKIIEVSGIITGSTEADFISKVREFVRQLLAESGQNLQIENVNGTFVYEGATLLNADNLVETELPHNVTLIPFRAQILAPKGFARSITQTKKTDLDITSVPFTSTITISGTAEPEPVVTLTFDIASTITDVTFTNNTTNEQITVAGLSFANGDKLFIDLAKKEVRHNTAKKTFTGIFPRFAIGLNSYTLTVAGSNNISQSQTTYNAEESVFGNTQAAQEYKVGAAQDISQIAVLAKKVVGVQEVLYDDFNDGAVNGAKWTTAGNVSESGGIMIIRSNLSGGAASSARQNANLSAAGDGCRFNVGVDAQGRSGDPDELRAEFTDGTDFIAAHADGNGANEFDQIVSSAFYGSLNIAVTGNGALKIQQEGADIKVYWQDVLKATIANKELKANSFMKFSTKVGSNADVLLNVDDAYRIVKGTANKDLDLRLETDNVGKPSGILLQNFHSGTAQAGASTSITLAAAASATTDEYKDMEVRITGGTGSGQTRLITAYNGTTKVATVATAWTTIPDGTSAYEVRNGRTLVPLGEISDATFSEHIKTFPKVVAHAAATPFHIVGKQSGGDAQNYLQVKKNTAGGYADGNLERTTDGGSTWTEVTAEDLYFKLWTPLPTGFNIDLEIAYHASHLSVV